MGHFAKIQNGIVSEVIAVNNETLENTPFPESEPIGVAFCKGLFGEDTEWVQTSYNSNFRGRYANPGMIYDAQKDEFIYPTEE